MSMSLFLSSFAKRRIAHGSSRRAKRGHATRNPIFEGLEDRISLTADVWTGAVAKSSQDFTWSQAGNWTQGAPTSGQDLIFPSAGATTFVPAHAIMNDLSNMTFDSIEIEAPGYSFAGNPITLTATTGIVANYAGVSTYSINTGLSGGSVTIASGAELDVDGVVTGGNGFALSGGGTLGGTGQVPTLTVAGSTVQPGVAGVGSLSVEGSATFSADSTFSTLISNTGVNTALKAAGTLTPVTLDLPVLSVFVAPGFIPAPGTQFPIIQGGVSGRFSTAGEGGYVTFGTTTFRVSYLQGAVLTAVEPTTIATSVQGGASTSVFGQSVTFTATISEASGKPTGSVTFEDGGSVLGPPVAVNASGVATFTTSQLSVGQHAITTVYGGDTKFAGSTSPAFNETVNEASTTTTVTSSANPSGSGQNVTFTAHVRVVSPGTGNPTDSVTFLDGGTVLGVATLNAGVATFPVSTLALGSHPITAVYGGDGNYAGSGSSAINQVVNKATTITTTDSSVNPSTFGQSVTFTATVAPAGSGTGTPTGSVTFFDGTTSLGTSPLNDGIATLSTSDLTPGAHSITSSYGGDSNFGVGTSAVVTQNVNEATTQVVVTPSPAASILGQSVTFTAVVTPVSPGSGVPAGSLTFLDGTIHLGTMALSAGSASISTSALTVGSHSITAVYDDNGQGFLGGTSSPVIELVGGTTVGLVSSTSPSTFGTSVTFTATVAASAAGSSVPTGSVTFMDGTQSLGSSPVNNSGVASISTASLSGGTHSITAVYGGASEFAPSTSSVTHQVVNPATTTTTLHLSAAQSLFSQSVTFTATVAGSASTPTGTVTFKDGSTVLGTAPVSATGVATFSSTTLTVGAHSLVAAYSGSASYTASASSQQALAVGQAATTTTLASSTSTAAVGQIVTFTATVAAAAAGVGSPTGTVVFHDGSAVIGTAPVSGGVASLSVGLSGGGAAHVIEATYSGTAGFAASDSAGRTVTVGPTTPVITLVATPDFVGKKARKATFVVLVQAGSTGGPVPTGSVTFEINHKTLRTVRLVNGSASVVVSSAKATGRTFLVSYRGDTNYKAASSRSLHIAPKFFKGKPPVI